MTVFNSEAFKDYYVVSLWTSLHMFYKSGAIINNNLKGELILHAMRSHHTKFPTFPFDWRNILRRCVGVTARTISSVICDTPVFPTVPLWGTLYAQLL
jgi:hypothetical protein